jgi:hypothetical protein
MSLRLLREIWIDVRGTVLVEGAITLPVLLVLFLGVFEFSWFFYEQHRVSTGIRDAARYIARSDNLDWTTIPPNIPPGSPLYIAAQNLATTGDTLTGVCPTTCRVAGWVPTGVNIETTLVGTISEVRVWTTFSPNGLGFLGFLNLGPITVTMDHYERLIPPPPPGGIF